MALAAPPLRLDVWVPQETLVQGEPLVLHYRLTNLANEDLFVELWEDAERFPIWLVGTTLQVSGRPPVTFAPGISRVDYGGGIYCPGVRIQVGQQFEGREVLSRWLPVLDPNNVDLHLVMQVPVLGSTGEPAASGPFQARQTISLVVAGWNPERLRARACSQLATLRMGPEVAEDADLDLLLALPVNEAGETWRSLAGDPTLDSSLRDAFVKSLGRHDSVLAADILAGLAWDPVPEPGTPPAHAARHARDQLLNLYHKASPVVTERARQLFLAHEGAVPL